MKNLLITFCVLALFACQKESIDPAPSNLDILAKKESKFKSCKTTDKLLVGNKCNSWIYTKYIINGNDISEFVAPCLLDNIITLTADGQYIETEGATKCSPEESDIHNQGKFEVTDCEKPILFLTSPGLTSEIEITELTKNSLKVKFFDPNVGIVEFWFTPVSNKYVCN